MGDTRKKILIVDDEAGIRDSLRLLLQGSFDVSVAGDGAEALARVSELRPDLVLLDLLMPTIDGLETLKQLRERNAEMPVIMLTGAATVKSAVQAMKWGAVDYLNKPFDIEALTTLIVETLSARVAADGSGPAERAEENQERSAPARRNAPPADFGTMIGRSDTMKEVFVKVTQVAERDTTVLITGESGTGKELIARQIHERSARHNKPFVAINCAAIPESLIESELFGHEKGAFTHAVERRLGHFELADGGTLFLDEIGELSLPVQVKMLRFLQEQEFYRVGRSKPIRVDVRIIAATNRGLEDLIAEKRFRQDLFYRINVINLALPPLRDRFDDIRPLVEYFIGKFSAHYGGRVLQFTPEALQVLVQYDWPGNVRELENVVESLMALAPSDVVGDGDLPRKLKTRASLETLKTNVFEGGMKFDDAEKIFETEMIVKALRKSEYVQTRAAEILGISRRILKYKMDKLGIADRPASIESEVVLEGALPGVAEAVTAEAAAPDGGEQ